MNNIRYYGDNTALDTYSHLQNDYYGNFYLTESNKINITNFKIFIKALADKEDRLIDNIIKKEIINITEIRLNIKRIHTSN